MHMEKINKIKIGQFIAECRKNKKITQEQLNEILAGEKIEDEDLKSKADENIVNITELYDLKASKSGVAAFTGISVLLLIYCNRKGIDTLPIIIIWLVYNLGYFLNQYRFTKDKKKIIIALLYGVGFIVTTILFVAKTLK